MNLNLVLQGPKYSLNYTFHEVRLWHIHSFNYQGMIDVICRWGIVVFQHKWILQFSHSHLIFIVLVSASAKLVPWHSQKIHLILYAHMWTNYIYTLHFISMLNTYMQNSCIWTKTRFFNILAVYNIGAWFCGCTYLKQFKLSVYMNHMSL